MTAINMSPSPEKSTCKKVAVFYPNFAGGGAECVGLWMLEALKHQYDLTLFTISDVDFNQLNLMYGTHLDQRTVKVRSIFNQGLRKPLEFLRANNADIRMLQFHILLRYLKYHSHEYDLVISAYNAADMGCQGMQYIHWVKVLEQNKIYNKVSNFSLERMTKNLSIANSKYVSQRFKELYDVEPLVIYPPVVMDVQDVPWEKKENTFICSGRLTKPKEPHKVIEILSRVREQGFDIKLCLTGGGGGTYAIGYQRFLQKMIDQNSDWITLYKNLPYQDYIKVMSKCRYGIHCKKEPFGISIAEMVKAGAIPFVKNRGGQVEIVGEENEDLLFANAEEATEKIVNLLKSPERLEKMRKSMYERRYLFGSDRFMLEMQNLVNNYFDKQN